MKRPLVALIILFCWSVSTAKAANIVERCAEGILKIRSYDVTYSLQTLNYPNPTEPEKPNVPTRDNTIENKRDVLAFGLGRRFEDFHGTDLQITTVMDWKTASFRENLSPAVKVAAALSMLGGGYGDSYLDFFNPNCSGFFLADLLRDSKSTIHMLDSSPPKKGLIGFEVEHPQVREPVRVWADSEHGYMPAIIETYFVNKNGQRELDDRTQVQEFIKVGDETWVPIKGIHDILLASGLNTGKPYTAILLVVNLGQSSWNSINSGTLFTEASMPPVNNNPNRDGFKRHYPPATLAIIDQAMKRYNDAVAKALSEGKPSRFGMFFVSSLLVLVLLTAIVIWHRGHRRMTP
jgi:hypothetical protein